MAFKAVAEDGTLTVGDVFLETTLKNIEANGKIAVSACDPASMEGYQIKPPGPCRRRWYPDMYTATEGPIVDTYKKLVSDMFKGAATASRRSYYHPGNGYRDDTDTSLCYSGHVSASSLAFC